MKLQELQHFVVSLPTKLDCTDTGSLGQCLFKGLYYAATNDGEHLRELFPKMGEEELDELKGYKFAEDFKTETTPFFNVRQKLVYAHPPGTICSRPLKKGEPVYRCEQCGYDETCVICVHCFDKYDHIDHNVHMYIGSGESGGVCDCGDPEAFTRPLNCKSQQLGADNNIEVDNCFAEALKITIKFCLDYVLDVTNFSVGMLPLIHDNINKIRPSFNSKYISDCSSLRSEAYGGCSDHNTDDLWYLILWNDERHSLKGAVKAIQLATGATQRRAEEVAHEIDRKGRTILKKADNYKDLLRSQKQVEMDGLVASIMSARDYSREVIVHNMILWLLDITENSTNIGFRELSKKFLGDLLLENNFCFSKDFPSLDICDSMEEVMVDDDLIIRLFESGLLLDSMIVKEGKTTLDYGVSEPNYEELDIESLRRDPRIEKLNESRIQYLLLFSIRFPSVVRKKLSELIIPPLISEASRKAIFCEHYLCIYPQLLTNMALADREEHLSIIGDISSQLLTCPTCVLQVIERNQQNFIMGPLTDIIQQNTSDWEEFSDCMSFSDFASDHPYDLPSVRKAIKRGLQDLEYLVDKDLPINKLDSFFKHDNLIVLLIFLRRFQEFWPARRKVGDHVEREVMDFVVHLDYSVPVLRIIRFLCRCKSDDIPNLQKGLKLILITLSSREFAGLYGPKFTHATFNVSEEPVSFINPINALISHLVCYQGFSNFYEVFSEVEHGITRFSDFSLRSIVLAAQVKVGFWIRNGVSISKLAFLYENSIMSDLSYMRDFHMNQIALVFDYPKSMVMNMVDRWGLNEWYNNRVTVEKLVYEEKFNAISEKFIIFLYNLIADRSNFFELSLQERARYKIRQTVLYGLSSDPKTYSQFTSELDSEMRGNSLFDEVLKECSDYQPPNGLIDSGLYKLKPELCEELDPMSLHLDTSQFQEVYDTVVESITKRTNQKKENFILFPRVKQAGCDLVDQNIGRFMKTVDFAKLVYKYLQYIIDTLDETFAFQLLHLFHAVLVDDQLVFGDKYLNRNFTNIPIHNLLMGIINSKLSKVIVKKADYLLNFFIERDLSIIELLRDSFGDEFMEKYDKKMAHSAQETESEKIKRRAESRKQKLLRKFAKQREVFLAKNNDVRMVETSEEERSFDDVSYKRRTCVICNEPESTNDVFGILATITSPSIFWKISDIDASYFSLAFQSWSEQQSPSNDEAYGFVYNYSDPKHPKIKGHVASTCGHTIHYRCFKESSRNSRFFPCPLCHSLRSLFVPSFIPPSNNGLHLSSDIMCASPKNTRYNQITHNSSSIKSSDIVSSLVHPAVIQATLELDNELRECLKGHFIPETRFQKYSNSHLSKNENFLHSMQDIFVLIANTIRMVEIATRIDGNQALYSFLSDISPTLKTLLRSLIQTSAFLLRNKSDYNLASDSEFQMQIENYWNSDSLTDSIFIEMVMLFFQTGESFSTLSRLAYTKFVTVCIYSLLSVFVSNPSYIQVVLVSKQESLTERNLSDMDSLVKKFEGIDQSKFQQLDRRALLETVWLGVERCFLPIGRQMIILQELLVSEYLGDAGFIIHPHFDHLAENIKSQKDWTSIEIICEKLDLPKFDELVLTLASDFSENTFELKTFDIVLNAKIPRFIEKGILEIDYPGVVRLISLPTDYNKCIMDPSNVDAKTVYDYLVCLNCGRKLKLTNYASHMVTCNFFLSIFFHPRLNSLKLITHIGSSPVALSVPGPYLTEHGEVKKPSNTGKALLNEARYHKFNKMWLSQELYSFVTRNVFGSRLQDPNTMPDIFNFPDEMDEDEDEGDGIFYDIDPFVF